MEIKVLTEFNKDLIRQSVVYSDDFQLPKQNIAYEVINLKDQGVIDALIALGWAPPKEQKPCK